MSKYQKPYIALISLGGLGLVLWALLQSATWDNIPLLIGMMVLAAISQVVTTISSRSGITFGVSQAVILATVAVLGPSAAVLVAAVDGISNWLINNVRDRENWRGSFEQLVFNTGMIVISAFAAGLTFVGLGGLVSAETLPDHHPHLDHFRHCLRPGQYLAGRRRHSLQHGVSPVAFWIQQRWAMPLNILIIAVGGSLVTYGAETLGVRGLFLLALPLLLFAYPFRLYITNSEAQIGELEKTNQVLADTNEELITVSRAKERLLAVLSHDMRTPLSTIHLYAILLLDRPDLSLEKRSRMLRSVLDSEETLARMVDNILELEQIRSGQLLDMDMVSVDLLDLIQRALSSVQAHADDKHISLSFAPAPGPILIEADSDKMIRTFQNLLSNAIKYSPEGAAVTITVGHDVANATVDVADNGYGIPAERVGNSL